MRTRRFRARVCTIFVLFGLDVTQPAWCQDEAQQSHVLSIDLATALRLADERNLDVAIYVERVAEAAARVAEARTLAVPTVRVGSDYARHTGNIQDTSGQVIDADRASRFTRAGIDVGVDISDAIFAPLVAKQNRAAVMAASSANRHEVFLDVSAAYLRLLESRSAHEVAQRALERALDLANLTANYAEAGEGLLAELFSGDEDVDALVARALADRPETDQYDALVAAAAGELKAQQYRLFIPGVSIGFSTGRFGGAPGSSIANTGDRDDLALTLFWQFDGFGLGHRARTDEKRAQLRRVGLERDKLRDTIAAEVRESYARVRSYKQQMSFADQAVASAERAYMLNRDRIYDQQGLPLEALQAMQALASAEVARLEARTSFSLAQIRLHTALGNPLNARLP
jgi:outer membrane protein TolC